jgi:hypothetical protein
MPAQIEEAFTWNIPHPDTPNDGLVARFRSRADYERWVPVLMRLEELLEQIKQEKKSVS